MNSACASAQADRRTKDVLSATGIAVGYGGPPVLDDVAITAIGGEIAVILGPNGAGKSTLAKALAGLLTLKSGRVLLEGQDVTGLGPHQLVRRGLAYLPQLENTFAHMSVKENLEMGGYILKSGLKQRIWEVLDLFPDLARDVKKRANALSGGQQRMLALARVLMTDPVAAVLDEPTAGLSPLYADRVWQQIDRIRNRGVALLVVEQNAQIAVEWADTVFLLANGGNKLSGRAEELRNNPEVAAILMG